MSNEKEKALLDEPGHELENKSEDPYEIIRVVVKVLAVIMIAVIVWGIGDVVHVLYQRIVESPFLLLSISDILAIAAAVLALGITYWLISKKV